MQYKVTETIIEEEISETYLIDGVQYSATIKTYGPYGVYGNMKYSDRQAVVEIENVGTVRLIFPSKEMMLIPTDSNLTRFTSEAEKLITSGVEKFIRFNHQLKNSSLVGEKVEYSIV
ncbi:MAG: hypothetical protein ACOXZZ_03530 [Sphaerochaetaceae bacterium]